MSQIYSKHLLGKLSTYYKTRLNMRDYKNGWMKGNCPHCGKIDKFGVNLIANRTNCFVCTENMNPIDTIIHVEGLENRQQVYNYLSIFKDAVYLEPKVEIHERKSIILPKDFRLLSFGKSEFSKLARTYIKGRGFNIDDLTVRGIGYCTKNEYKGYIIFPFYQQGKLIYYTTRRFISLGSKFKNPNLEDFGIGKSSIIYNIDALAIYNKVRIVESVTNALTLDDRTIAIDGKLISNYQLSCILRSPIKAVEIILDRDAYYDALKIALKLIHHVKVRVILMPTDDDVNKVGRKKVKNIIKKTSWLTYKELYKKFINYEKPEFTYS